jgi:alpha-glucosidase
MALVYFHQMNSKAQIPPDPDWWRRAVVYHIYPRSFQDSNGDGIGDLLGIRQRLDYLQDLGIDTLWLSPTFSSPQRDFGYDIRDYHTMAPEYGTVEDMDALIEDVHARGMRLVLDLVMNHTSDEHPWFRESAESRTNPRADWYIWADGKDKRNPARCPPNNWKSMVGGRAWHYSPQRQQWYLASFLPFQPDLNYRNPAVHEAMLAVVRYWLDRGADGYRLDIFHVLYKDAALRDNPFSWRLIPTEENPAGLFQEPRYNLNQPETITFARTLRKVVDEFLPTRFLVGEVAGNLDQIRGLCGGDAADGLHLAFLFQTLSTPLRAEPWRELITEAEAKFAHPLLPTWVFSNHDRVRSFTRLGEDTQKAKLLALLQLTLRGVPFIYYGEEIGTAQHDLPLASALDPVAHMYRWVPRFLLPFLKQRFGLSFNRDECRTPMAWTAKSADNYGFTSGANPWLPFALNATHANVETQEADEHSLWHFYRQLLHLRRETPALNSGGFELIDIPASQRKSLLAFRRTHPKGDVSIWLNLASKSLQIPVGDAQILARSALVPFDGTLGSWSGVVVSG